MMPTVVLRILAPILFLSALARAADAAPPQLSAISVRGLQPGENALVLRGSGFSDATQIVLPVAVESQTLVAGAALAPDRIEIALRLPADVPRGVFPLHVATEEGVSNPLLVVIDELPNSAETEPNNERAQATPVQAPAAVTGALVGSESDFVAFRGTAGRPIVAEVEARRLGANFRPVLHLYDERMLELGHSAPLSHVGGDARIVVTLPADGTYYVELHDAVYGADGSQYRLKIGELDVADAVFPLGVQAGATAELSLIAAADQPQRRISFSAAGDAAREDAASMSAPLVLADPGNPPRLPDGSAAPSLSAAPLPVAVGRLPEVLEMDSADGSAGATPLVQEVTLPVTINGRLAREGEVDRYRIAVAPGAALRFDVMSQRLGMPLDGVLEIQDEAGQVLASNDDRAATADPGLEFTIPAETTAVVVTLRDFYLRGGPLFAYRLSIQPVAGEDFSLDLLPADGGTGVPPVTANIPAGGTAVLRVRAARVGYNGPIRLRVEGAPEGLLISGNEIPAGLTDTLLSLTAPPETALAVHTLRIIGEGGPAERPIVRAALLAADPATSYMPWLRDELASAIARPAPLRIEVVSAADALALGVPYTVQVRIVRSEGVAGAANLSVLTSQVPAEGQGQIAAAENQQIAADATEGQLVVNVPANVPQVPIDLVISATLLDSAGQPAATALTPSRRLPVTVPFSVELVEAPALRPGAVAMVRGRVVRQAPFAAPVSVSLGGAPGTIGAAPVVVPGDQSDFSLAVRTSPSQTAAEFPAVTLAASAAVDGSAMAAASAPAPLRVEGEAPPLLEIFEDGPHFLGELAEGGVEIVLHRDDRYSGAASVLVRPGQRYSGSIAGWGIPIVENPVPGQYRYIQFAWRKVGGSGIMLQLARDGQFGPPAGQAPTFRYLAGPDPQFNGALAVTPVADAPPGAWVVVTRDLYADFGAFTLTGIALTTGDGEYGLFDHVYLGRTMEDFANAAPAAE